MRLLEPVDGVAVLDAVLRAEEGLACHQTLERTARAMRAEGDVRSVSQLMADLLVERVLGGRVATTDEPMGPARWATPDGSAPWPDDVPARATSLDPEPDDPVWDLLPTQLPDPAASPVQSRPPPRGHPPYAAEIQVVLGARTLLWLDDEPALLRGYGPVAASVARELADNAARRSMRALFADPVDQRLLTMDSSARFFTGRLGDLCRWRDQACRLTGGAIRDVDHREERGLGGATSARNGQSLGRNAHVVKDHPGIHCRPVDREPVGDGLDALRRDAPDVEWRLPAGQVRTAVCRPCWATAPGPIPTRGPARWPTVATISPATRFCSTPVPDAGYPVSLDNRTGHHGGVLEVRRIGPDDWAEWRALRLAALEEAPEAFRSRLADWDGAQEERWRARLTTADQWCNLVARLDGRPVGLTSGSRTDDGATEVHSMWVDPSARGQGVGDVLIGAVVAWSAEQGASEVRLDVREANRAAIRLYERNGFVDSGPADPVPGEPPERVMTRVPPE